MATQGRRRALGQHFLRDTSVTQKIAETILQGADRHQCQGLLEIGPGKGAITLPILERISKFPRIQKFLLVERDQKLGAFWKEEIQTHSWPNVSVQVGDFLEQQPSIWLHSKPLAVVSNLPYSAGTAILNRLADEFAHIPVMVLMFQAEVAKRLKAGPSSSGRGSLSVWIQNQWDVQSLVYVPPKAFSPPPDVNSEVVVLTRRPQPMVDVYASSKHLDTWQAVLKACFAHRRKMLRSTFPWPMALQASGVDPTLRAEALDWPQWASLYHAVLAELGLS